MLEALQNLPFAVKKLIHWILPLVLGCLSLNILFGIIGFIHFLVIFIAVILFAPHLLGNEDLWKLWIIIEMIRVPTYSLIGSFIIVRSSSRRLGRLLFPEFKKKRTTS